MAFLASGVPVVDEDEPGQPILNGFEDSRTLGFRALDGTDLLFSSDGDYIARWGITGLDVPPRTIVEQDYQGQDGSDLDDIQVGSRSWLIPLRIGSDDGHRAFLERRAQLRALMNHRRVDYRLHGGTFDVVATNVLGERRLRSVYVDGLGGDWQQNTSGSYFETVPLQGRATRPYWTGDRWSTPPIQRPAALDGLGNFPISLSPSRTLGGDITITVPGDVSSYVRIDAGGPAPYVEITGPGLYLLLPDGLADGETLTLDTYPPTWAYQGALFNGVLDWSRLAPNRRLSAIPPGDQTFNLDLGNAGAAAFCTISGPTLYETPW